MVKENANNGSFKEVMKFAEAPIDAGLKRGRSREGFGVPGLLRTEVAERAVHDTDHG